MAVKKYNKLGMKKQVGEQKQVIKPLYDQPHRPPKEGPIVTLAQNEKKAKYVPWPFHQDGRIPFVAFGDARVPQAKRGSFLGLTNTCYKSLKKIEQQGLLSVVKVNKYLASQVSLRCGQRELAHVDIDGDALYSVLACGECTTLWQRDVNASQNTPPPHISNTHIQGGERPQSFSRE